MEITKYKNFHYVYVLYNHNKTFSVLYTNSMEFSGKRCRSKYTELLDSFITVNHLDTESLSWHSLVDVVMTDYVERRYYIYSRQTW